MKQTWSGSRPQSCAYAPTDLQENFRFQFHINVEVSSTVPRQSIALCIKDSHMQEGRTTHPANQRVTSHKGQPQHGGEQHDGGGGYRDGGEQHDGGGGYRDGGEQHDDGGGEQHDDGVDHLDDREGGDLVNGDNDDDSQAWMVTA